MRILNSNVKVKTTTFGELTLGDCYRTLNGEHIHMKIKTNSSANSVSLSSGLTFTRNDSFAVIPVNGGFLETNEE